MENSEALRSLMFKREFLDKLPRDWKYIRIKDLEDEGIISDIQDGNHGELHPKSSDYVSSGIPFVMAKDLANGRLNLDECQFISKKQADSLRIGFAQPGDVLLTHKATMGRVAIVPNGYEYVMLTPQVTYYRIGDKERLDNIFLKYAFLSPNFQHQLNATSDQSTRKFIGITAQRDLWLLIPPLSEQQSIARILSILDDKIELNRQMNNTLESIARAVFKSWFIDFDPVQSKLEGHEPYGMDIETAALFPGSFEDSVLGKIPKEWNIKNLPEVIEINPQHSLSKGQPAPYLEMSNMPTSSARALDWEYRDFSSGMKFMNGDVLLARITPCLENGKTAYVDFLADGQVGWGSTEYIVFCSKPPLPKEYAYFLARSDELRTHAVQNMTGTSGRQRVPAECFKAYSIVVPPEKIAVRFGEIVRPFMLAIKQYDKESHTLAAIRDALLPKLLSGEIRVKKAEKYAEALI